MTTIYNHFRECRWLTNMLLQHTYINFQSIKITLKRHKYSTKTTHPFILRCHHHCRTSFNWCVLYSSYLLLLPHQVEEAQRTRRIGTGDCDFRENALSQIDAANGGLVTVAGVVPPHMCPAYIDLMITLCGEF